MSFAFFKQILALILGIVIGWYWFKTTNSVPENVSSACPVMPIIGPAAFSTKAAEQQDSPAPAAVLPACEPLVLVTQIDSTFRPSRLQAQVQEIVEDDYDSPDYWRLQLYADGEDRDKLNAIDELILLQASDDIAVGLGDNSAQVRRATIAGLLAIGDERALAILGQVLFGDFALEHQLQAAEALQQLQHFSAAAVLLDNLPTPIKEALPQRS